MDEIKLYKPYSKQIPIHKACNDKETFFITAVAGRQAGKTALAQQQAIYWALKNDNVVVYWVSPTAGQATKVYKQLLEMIIRTPVLKSYKGGQGDTEIIFINGSRILFRSAAQEDSLRGETIEYLIVDEAAFQKEDVFTTILLPMLNVRGRKCLAISTGKGKNWFFHQYQRGLSADKDYKSFKFLSSDNPYANPIVIQIAKDNLPEVLFRQEYLGEFIDSSAIFENVEELCCLDKLERPIVGQSYWMGIDIALKDDYTVITVINKDNDVVWYDRFNHVTAPQLKQRVIDANRLWKPKKIMIEENNQGLPIIDDLKIVHKITNIVGFKTTSTSKQEIVNNLINAFSSKKIKVPKDDIYKSELETFTMTISPTGQPKFAAASGFHDDIPMSLAITWECVNKYKYNGTYNFV
jgi:phage FluMu gp28-like protein